MSSDRRPAAGEQETKPLLVLELWQLVLLVVALLALVWKVLLGGGVPKLGLQGLAILFLVVALGGVLVVRERKKRAG